MISLLRPTLLRCEDVCILMVTRDSRETVLRALRTAQSISSQAVIASAPGHWVHDKIDEFLFTSVKPLSIPWSSYGAVSNEALQAAYKLAPWVLVLHGDDQLSPNPTLPTLPLDTLSFIDAFDVLLWHDESKQHSYRRTTLLRSASNLRFEHPLHEVLMRPDGAPPRTAFHEGFQYLRSGSSLAPADYAEHAKILETEAAQGCVRCSYYYAQSLRDAGKHAEALAAYVRRGNMSGGFLEENFHSWMQAGYLAWNLHFPWDGVASFFLTASSWAPRRAEPYAALSRLYQSKGDAERSFTYQAMANACPWPEGVKLGVEASAYRESERR